VRRDARFPVRVHVFDADPTQSATQPTYLGTSVDLSEAGILVKTRRDVGVGTQLGVRFALPGRPDELVLRGRAVRVDTRAFEPQRGLAIAFEELGEGVRLALRDYLKVLTQGRPFVWQLGRADELDGRQTVALSGLIGGPADLHPLKSLRGLVDYRLHDLERLGADGVQVWLDFARAVSGQQRIRLFECPVWFVQQATLIPNLTEGQEVVSLLAPYACDRCGLDQDRLIDVARDLDGGKRRVAPELSCVVCEGPLALAEPAEVYFAMFTTP
jgi:hypothetical protein